MSILVNKETRVVVQGLTGKEGSFTQGSVLIMAQKLLPVLLPQREGHYGKRRCPSLTLSKKVSKRKGRMQV